MSKPQHGVSYPSTLCRCGRTTALDDGGAVARRMLDCGHYICADCWHHNNPMPTPICFSCVLALQSQEIPRLALYASAYHELLERYKELERIHTQRMTEWKTASDTILVLKSKLASLHKGQNQAPNTTVASASSPHHPVQPLPNIGNVSTATASSGKAAVMDWNSESGRHVSSYILKQREAMATVQAECDTLKSRIAELTKQLEAKNQADQETITVVEKAELMEAELEGLHERLDKCEEDLEKAREELAASKTQNEALTKEINEFKERATHTRSTLAKAQFSITMLQNRCNVAEANLASARESLKAKDEVIKANARSHSRETSIDITTNVSSPRTAVYVPTAAELEQATSKLTSLQSDVTRLNEEKATLEQELSELKETIQSSEEENRMLGRKLLQSAELAAELGRIHLAASARADVAEEKLSSAEKDLQSLKENLQAQEREHKALQDATGGPSKQAEYQSRIGQLETSLAETTRLRDEALAQLEVWERNRNAWKRWGEVMALRAKQWEDEAVKAKIPRPKNATSVQLEEPPPLPSLDIHSISPSDKPRKRPLDMPDTDVDGLRATAQANSGNVVTHDSSEEGSERKKARLQEARGKVLMIPSRVG